MTRSTLEQITDLIVCIANPQRVFLFGSQADRTQTENSDLDLMIVVGDDVEDLRGLQISLHLEISSLTELPCDVLVEHESTFLRRSALPTIERTILQKGQTLYAA